MADTKVSALTELTVPPDPTDELVLVDKSDTTMAASGTDKRIQFSNFFDWAEAGDLSTIEPDDAAAAGTSVEIARADHQHAIAAATAGTIEPDDAAAEGAATSFARSDHKHAVVAASATTLTGGNQEGVSTSFARADHDHAMPIGMQTMLPQVRPIASAPVSSATGATGTYYVARVELMEPITLTGIVYRVGTTSNGNARCSLWNGAATTRLADRTSASNQPGIGLRHLVPFDSQYVAASGVYNVLIWFSSATATWMGARYLINPTLTGTNATVTPTSISALAHEDADRPIMTAY